MPPATAAHSRCRRYRPRCRRRVGRRGTCSTPRPRRRGVRRWWPPGRRLRRSPVPRVRRSPAGVYGGAPVGSGRGRAVLRRDAGLPEERRRLGQGRRLAARRRTHAGRRTPATPTSSSSTPARSSRRRARSRSTSRSALADAKRPGARLVVTGCMAERYGDELAAALPEADAVVGLRRRGLAGRGRAARAASRPACATCSSCPARADARRGRTSRSPRAATARARSARSRRSAASSASRTTGVDRGRGARRSCEAGAAEIVLVAQDLAWYGRDVGEPGALAPLLRRLDRLAADGLERVRLLYLYPSEVQDPLVCRRCSSSRRSCRTSTCRCSTRSAATAAADEAVGERRPLPRRRSRRIRADEPRRRVPLVVHRRVPGRDRGRPRRAARVPARRARSTGPASSRSRPRTAPPAATLDGVAEPELTAERLRECSERPGPDHAGRARRARRRRRSRCSSTASTPRPALVGRTHREAPEIDGVVRIAGADVRPPGRDRHRRGDRRDRSRPGRGARCSRSVAAP